MYTTATYALLWTGIAASLASATALPASLEPRACTTIRPANFYGISTQTKDTTQNLGPFPPDNYFDFRLSQTGNGQSLQSENDLVSTFTNVPCPAGRKYSVEFLFEPISDYGYNGITNIDVYAIKGSLPRDGTGKGIPTWNNLKTKTGSLIGSFAMPQGQDQVHRVYKIGQIACSKEVNLRLSITNTGYQTGGLSYAQQYAGQDSGLRLRNGC